MTIPPTKRTRRSSGSKRGARKGLRRSKTIPTRRLSKDEIAELRKTLAELEESRPELREDCRTAERPCPYVSCKYHLFLDINPETGSIKINFPDLEVWEMSETCALDVADRGGITLEEVGELLNLTRERIRQVEVFGLDKLRSSYEASPEDGEETPEES
jgi:hypothetical protein